MVQWWALIATSVMVVATAAGNVLVCLAITWERRLQNMTNYFLMSLAITDLMVAILVMPLGILTLVIGSFPLEPVYCLTWISLDVLFCTASIMHLCTISVDRYLSLRYPMKFGRNKTRRRVVLKIAFVWLLSIAMCLPLSLRYSKDYNQVLVKGVCQIPDPVYKLIGSIVSFYIPLLVMLITFALTVRLLAQQQQNLGDTNCQWLNTPPMERDSARRSTWRRFFPKGSSSTSRHLQSTSSAPLTLATSHHHHHSSAETEMSALDHHDLWLQDTEPPPPSTMSALHQFGAELLKLSRGLESLPPKSPERSQELNDIEDLDQTITPRPEDIKEEKNTINFITSGSSLRETKRPLKTNSLRLVRKGACRRRTRASTIHVDSPQRNSLKRTSIEIRKRVTSYHGPSNRWGTSDSSSADEGKDAEEGKEDGDTEEKEENTSKTTPKTSFNIEYKRFDNQHQTSHNFHRRRYSHPHQYLMTGYSCIKKCNARCKYDKTDKHNHSAHVSSTINPKSSSKVPIMDKNDPSGEVSYNVPTSTTMSVSVCGCSNQQSIRNKIIPKSSTKDCKVLMDKNDPTSGEVSYNHPASIMSVRGFSHQQSTRNKITAKSITKECKVLMDKNDPIEYNDPTSEEVSYDEPTSNNDAMSDNVCGCSHHQSMRFSRVCEVPTSVDNSHNGCNCSNQHIMGNLRTSEIPVIGGDVPTSVNTSYSNNNDSCCCTNQHIMGNLRNCKVPTSSDTSHCNNASRCCSKHHTVGNCGFVSCGYNQRLAYSCGDIRRMCNSELGDGRTSSSEFFGKNENVSKNMPSPISDRVSEKNSAERHSMMLLPPPCRCPYFGDVENDRKTSPNRTNEVVIVTSSAPHKSPLRRRSKQYSLKTSESDDTASTASTPLHFTPRSGRTSSTVTLGSVKRKSECDQGVTRNDTVVTWESPQPSVFGHRRGSSFGSTGTARTMVMTSERNRFTNLRRAVTLKMPKHNGAIFATAELSRVSSTLTIASKNSKIRGPYSRNSSILFRTSSRHGRIIRLEQKATKVLGVVFFTFVILWAPFFILNLLPSICGDCEKDIGKGVFDFATWLGYASSMVNPIFYTIFNKVFRQAFKKVLLCKYHRKETWKPTKPNK